MGFKPLLRMWERVDVGRADSDTTLFHDLMYLGEMVTKTVVAALVAAIEDDTDRSRHRLVCGLVRADGIGDWSTALADVLTGPSSQHLLTEARTEQRELSQKCAAGQWQYEAASLLDGCLHLVDTTAEPLPARTDGLRWIRDFARLRNKTRGHGAPKTEILASLCPQLERALRLWTENHSLFSREWAHLHRNLSGKYRVTKLSETATAFDELKRTTNEVFRDGLYVHLGGPVLVELARSDVDASDFYLANGGFNDRRFEMLSYATGNTLLADATPYLGPTTSLPGSETGGLRELECIGKCLTNLPPSPRDYISRVKLEGELLNTLRSDRHPVITLVGRGGIGKTSLALTALHTVANETRFDLILWFSARDLDLRPEGPKQVRPAVLTVKDVANEFVSLVSPSQAKEKGFKPVSFLAESLTKSEFGPTLYVFDNFETVINPGELFKWIDTYIRHPNSVLITTRHREFKGDYPIEVRGMSEIECEQLIDSIGAKLGITSLLTTEYRDELFRESEGHPYVVRILLGEVAKAGRIKKVERIIADVDEILTALFERTYASLSPVAQRVFLTLSNWRTTIPKLALESVLLRPQNEKMAVSDAIEELERCSFIELLESEADQTIFVDMPLVAAMFGRRKLAVSPLKIAIEADTEILHQFGAGLRTDVRHGVGPRIERLAKSIARRVVQENAPLDEYLPMLEFLARHYPPTWILVASLHEEIGTPEAKTRAKDALRHHLEVAEGRPAIDSWRRLADICKQTGDSLGELHALVELSERHEVPFDVMSDAANRLNFVLADNRGALDTDEKEVLLQRLATAMDRRLDEADATACSRLAWLHLKLKDPKRAHDLVHRGLQLDPRNEHCVRLSERLAYASLAAKR